MSDIEAQLAAVQARLAKAAQAAGRAPETLKLIAVSKTQPSAAIREAYAAGQRAFGENYVQELVQKAEELEDLDDLEWHFIGHLQSNKAKQVVKVASLVHTVDSASLAKELGKRATQAGVAPRAVLIEVNVGAEPQKFGVLPADLADVMAAVLAEPGLSLRGLMTVPPAGDSLVARRVFETLATLRVVHGGKERLPELSMGMSGDLEEAVASGATLLRVGTAIFGHR